MKTTENFGSVDILSFIDVRKSDLSPVEASIAAVILSDPERAADCTIGQLAQLAGSSEATVTRFCRSIGLSGYAQLRMKLAVAVDQRRSGGEVSGFAMLEEFEPGDPLDRVVEKVASANAQAAALTGRQLDLADLTRAIDALTGARRILCIGVGSSAIPAADAAGKLRMTGRAATDTPDVHSALMTTSHYRKGDVVLAFSHSGRSREIIDILDAAAERGATTILVTNAEGTPAARRADILLRTAAHETSFRSGGLGSRIAQLTVVDILFVAMSHEEAGRAAEAAESMHEAVRGHVVTERGAR